MLFHIEDMQKDLWWNKLVRPRENKRESEPKEWKQTTQAEQGRMNERKVEQEPQRKHGQKSGQETEVLF